MLFSTNYAFTLEILGKAVVATQALAAVDGKAVVATQATITKS